MYSARRAQTRSLTLAKCGLSEPEVTLDEIVGEAWLPEPDCVTSWVATDVARELATGSGESMTDDRVAVALVESRLESTTDAALENMTTPLEAVADARASEEREIPAELQASS